MKLGKYSIGIGDRFGRQGRAQLQALIKAKESGLDVVPVWNKSHREHTIIGSVPMDVRREADEAVRAMNWAGPYYVDADHIGLHNVDFFLEASDFFTIDVADFIGRTVGEDEIRTFIDKHRRFIGQVTIPGLGAALEISEGHVGGIAAKYLLAVKEASRIYRHIEAAKGKDNFVTEVSLDETDTPQTPVEMLFILAGLADEKIPVQTFAPKFKGRFNKGVDYVGEVAQFEREVRELLAVLAFAVKEFGLAENLKLSVHSGSDKFSIYKSLGQTIRQANAGLHLKTSGTTWLEELIGLSEAGGEGLLIAKEIYRQTIERFEELCKPYAAVIDINRYALPSAATVDCWTSEEFAAALRHDPSCGQFNPNLRQLLHVGYKVAAGMGDRYLRALDEFALGIAPKVTANLYERHIKPIFGELVSSSKPW